MKTSFVSAMHRAGTWSGRMHLVAVAVVAGLVVGLPLGVLNRVFQRITAITADLYPEFTVAGSLAIVVATVLPFAIPAGILYVALRERLPRRSPGSEVGFALTLMLVFTVPYLWTAPMGINTTGNVWVNRAMYGGLVLLGGLTIPRTVDWVAGRLPPSPGRIGRVIEGLLVLLGVVSVAFALLLAVMMFRSAS